ncbi:MAG: phenylacetate--CoA ligase family protein [Euzebya sp.]
MTSTDSGSEMTAAVPSERRAAGLANAWRSPFFSDKLRAGGLRQGQVPDAEQWLDIPLTTKDELRAMSAAEFDEQLVVAAPADIALYWRSGGVTGRPLFYPKAHADLPQLIQSFSRVLTLAGITSGDLAHNSFPFAGVHPVGHMFGHALAGMGAGNIFAGAGSNTPTDAQVELLFTLKPTVWMGIGSYLTQLGHRAELAGHDPRASTLRVALSSAEPLTPAKRRRMQQTWDVELYDCYGMTECSMMGGECRNRDGLHVWTDMFQLEILDEQTLRPVPSGQDGLIVVTPFHSMNAIPFIRWSPGDIGRIDVGCDCGHGHYPRLTLGSRTVGFSKVRGVNINHNDLEDALLSNDDIADFMVTVATTESTDEILIEVETGPATDQQAAQETIRDVITSRFEVRPRVVMVDRGTVATRLEREIKQVRVRDLR